MVDYSAISYEKGSNSTYSEGIFSPFKYTGIYSISYDKGNLAAYSKGSFSPFKYTGISSIFYTPLKSKYFEMMAYDTSASIWRTWSAIGAPDTAASQYPGSPFPFTTVFVLSTIEGK